MMTPHTFRNRVGIAFQCSGFRGPEHPFGLDPLIGEKPGGWVRYLRLRIMPLYHRGYRRFLLHLPLGEFNPSDRYMDLDSPVHLANSHQYYVLKDFHDAMKIVRDEMPDALFIAYFGTHGVALNGVLEAGQYEEHSSRLHETIAHVIDNPQIGAAFDHLANEKWTDDHPIVGWLHYVKAIKARQGLPTIIEAWPRIKGPAWMHAWHAIAWHVFTLTRRKTGVYIEQTTEADRYEVLSGHTPEDKRPDAVTFTAECIGRIRYIPFIEFGQMVPYSGFTHDEFVYSAFARAKARGLHVNPSWLTAYPDIAKKTRVIDAMKINASSARREQQGGAA